MKLRLRENSIRLRLLQSEIRQLRETGSVSEQIVFGIDAIEILTYSLKTAGEAQKISARLTNNQIEILIPVLAAENWANTETVGIYETQMVGNSGELKIIIEKDFVCPDRQADEDNTDAFPHPKMKC